MSFALFQYPEKAYFNRVIPKTKFYENANINKSVKDAFVSQIQQIVWAYKLSPETINLSATKRLLEIQVFNIHLKEPELSENVLFSIDKAIPHPIIFQLIYDQQIKVIATYKRPSESDEAKWVLDQYYSSGWLTPKDQLQLRKSLPVALNLSGLYEQILKELIPIEAKDGENIREQSARLKEILQKHAGIKKLEADIAKEKQFNRKVELKARLKVLQKQLVNIQQ
jgi:hypothetical protein